MRGMILAAGAGKRMGALTETIPKPLLKVAGKHLIEYSIAALSHMGIDEIAINLCHHREQIKTTLGCGKRYGVKFFYSEEEEALETGGGVFKVLPFFEGKPFVVLSSDVVMEFPLHTLPREPKQLAHIILVDNPYYHPEGDFGLEDHRVSLEAKKRYTFANIGVYRPELFANYQGGRFLLGEVLKNAVQQQQVTGESYEGAWFNIGTPQELDKANALLNYRSLL